MPKMRDRNSAISNSQTRRLPNLPEKGRAVMEKMFIRDLVTIIYNSPDTMTDGQVLDAVDSYLKERAVEIGVSLDDLAAGR